MIKEGKCDNLHSYRIDYQEYDTADLKKRQGVNMREIADLHMHSTASDGTDDVKMLLKAVRKKNINTFALTDHDTIQGVVRMQKEDLSGLHFITGIEFSCKLEGKQCHILGLGYDPLNYEFLDAVIAARVIRQNKMKNRLIQLKELFGIELPAEDQKKLLGKQAAGKPHIAEMLINRGLVPEQDLGEVIRKYFPSSLEEYFKPEEAIRGILAGGGIPVWAHPMGESENIKKHLSLDRVEKRLECLMPMGLKGMECYYSRYTLEECRELEALAGRYGLLVSGGSDYHGYRKNVQLAQLSAENNGWQDTSHLTVLNELRK